MPGARAPERAPRRHPGRQGVRPGRVQHEVGACGLHGGRQGAQAERRGPQGRPDPGGGGGRDLPYPHRAVPVRTLPRRGHRHPPPADLRRPVRLRHRGGPLCLVHHLDPVRGGPVQDRYLRQSPRGLGRHPQAGAARGAQRGAEDGQGGAGGGRLGRGVRGQPRVPVGQRPDHSQGQSRLGAGRRSLPAQLPPGHLLAVRGRAHTAGAAAHRGAAPVARGDGRHRLRVRHRNVHVEDGLRGQGHRARGGGHRGDAPGAVRREDDSREHLPLQHLDRHQYL